jgi:hypothetical protein
VCPPVARKERAPGEKQTGERECDEYNLMEMTLIARRNSDVHEGKAEGESTHADRDVAWYTYQDWRRFPTPDESTEANEHQRL